ncbi:MAG: hypothetical protein IRY83_17205 [Chloroflexi bacterium]|jgi:hypothetical protein|nr:hypothetical protein [Chloroflexota bacterium]
MSILEVLLAPWLPLAVLLGVAWSGIAIAAAPPHPRWYPAVIAAAVPGSLLGQVAGAVLHLPLPVVGDLHPVEASLGAILSLGIVRLLCAW